MARILQFQEENKISTLIASQNFVLSTSTSQPSATEPQSTPMATPGATKPSSGMRKRRASQDLAELTETMDDSVDSQVLQPNEPSKAKSAPLKITPVTPTRRSNLASIYDITPERSNEKDPSTEIGITASPFGNTSAISSVVSSIITPSQALAQALSIVQSNILLHSTVPKKVLPDTGASPVRPRNTENNHVKFQDIENATITVNSSRFGLPTVPSDVNNTDPPTMNSIPTDHESVANVHGDRTPVRVIPNKDKVPVLYHPYGEVTYGPLQSPMMATGPKSSLIPVSMYGNEGMLSPTNIVHHPSSHTVPHGPSMYKNATTSSSPSHGTSIHTTVAYSPILMNNSGIASTGSGSFYYTFSPMNSYVMYHSTSQPEGGYSATSMYPTMDNGTKDGNRTENDETVNYGGNEQLFQSPFTSIHMSKRIIHQPLSVVTDDSEHNEELANAIRSAENNTTTDDDNTTIELTDDDFVPNYYPVEQAENLELPHGIHMPDGSGTVPNLVPLPVSIPNMPYLQPGMVPLNSFQFQQYYPTVQSRIIPTRSIIRSQHTNNVSAPVVSYHQGTPMLPPGVENIPISVLPVGMDHANIRYPTVQFLPNSSGRLPPTKPKTSIAQEPSKFETGTDSIATVNLPSATTLVSSSSNPTTFANETGNSTKVDTEETTKGNHVNISRIIPLGPGKLQITNIVPSLHRPPVMYYPPVHIIPINKNSNMISYDGNIIPMLTNSGQKTIPMFHFSEPIKQPVAPGTSSQSTSSAAYPGNASSHTVIAVKGVHKYSTSTHDEKNMCTTTTKPVAILSTRDDQNSSPVDDTIDMGTDYEITTSTVHQNMNNSFPPIQSKSIGTSSTTFPPPVPSSGETANPPVRRGPGRPRKDSTTQSSTARTIVGKPSTKKVKLTHSSSSITNDDEDEDDEAIKPNGGRNSSFVTSIFDRNIEAAEKITKGAVSPTTLAKHTNRLLWQPGCSRYLGVTRGAGKNEFKWFTTFTFRDENGESHREGSHYLSRTRAEQFFIERAKKYNVDITDRIRVLWPGEPKARELEAKLGIDWDTGFTIAELKNLHR